MGNTAGQRPANFNDVAPLWRNRDFLLAGVARFMAAAGMGAVVVSVMLHLQSTAASGTAFLPGPGWW
ncbi:hypothetical protein AHiyo6_35450, partial [Arthrobacter sp. Hiyo6]